MNTYPFTAVVGHEQLKTALILAAIDPQLGGVLISGPRGSAKSTLARGLAELLPEQSHFVDLPLSATEERVVGSLNLEKVLADGSVAFAPGLLQRAHNGILYIDEVNLLADHLVDLLLDVAASGVNYIERDSISHQHPARFVLVGTMNPEEGELRPQLLDRFGLAIYLSDDFDVDMRMEIMQRRIAFDNDPQRFLAEYADAQQQLSMHLQVARERLPSVSVAKEARRLIADCCMDAGVEGVRADLSLYRAARAYAAWQNQPAVTDTHISHVADWVLNHRRRHRSSNANPPATPSETQENKGNDGSWGTVPPQLIVTGKPRMVPPIADYLHTDKKKA